MPYLKLPVVRVSKNQILRGRVKSFRFSAKAVQSGQACLVALYVFSEYGSIQIWHLIPSGFQSLFSLQIINYIKNKNKKSRSSHAVPFCVIQKELHLRHGLLWQHD